jgi:DNA-binding response OmpR family regulator
MRTTNILIAEDDSNLRQGLVDLLEDEGYQVAAAADGQQALVLFGTSRPDLVLLDVMMPELSGYDVCRQIRQKDAAIPIIMLTAKSEEIDKVVGLELGADDYITKPFGLHELRARVKALLRRAGISGQMMQDPQEETFLFGTALINRKRLEACLGNNTFRLTLRELKLLDIFHQNPGEILSRDRLLNDVWGIDYQGTTRTLDQHIAQLRKKVEAAPEAPHVIITAHGIGYQYTGSPD